MPEAETADQDAEILVPADNEQSSGTVSTESIHGCTHVGRAAPTQVQNNIRVKNSALKSPEVAVERSKHDLHGEIEHVPGDVTSSASDSENPDTEQSRVASHVAQTAMADVTQDQPPPPVVQPTTGAPSSSHYVSEENAGRRHHLETSDKRGIDDTTLKMRTLKESVSYNNSLLSVPDPTNCL